jgi:hypothetical protein
LLCFYQLHSVLCFHVDMYASRERFFPVPLSARRLSEIFCSFPFEWGRRVGLHQLASQQSAILLPDHFCQSNDIWLAGKGEDFYTKVAAAVVRGGRARASSPRNNILCNAHALFLVCALCHRHVVLCAVHPIKKSRAGPPLYMRCLLPRRLRVLAKERHTHTEVKSKLCAITFKRASSISK